MGDERATSYAGENEDGLLIISTTQMTGRMLGAGLLAGALLWLLTDLVSQSNIAGDGWSLRGNGALIIVFAGVPAVLGAGWAALALLGRGRRPLPGALVAGAVLLVLAGTSAFFLLLYLVTLLATVAIAIAAVWADRRLALPCLALLVGLSIGVLAPARLFGVG